MKIGEKDLNTLRKEETRQIITIQTYIKATKLKELLKQALDSGDEEKIKEVKKEINEFLSLLPEKLVKPFEDIMSMTRVNPKEIRNLKQHIEVIKSKIDVCDIEEFDGETKNLINEFIKYYEKFKNGDYSETTISALLFLMRPLSEILRYVEVEKIWLNFRKPEELRDYVLDNPEKIGIMYDEYSNLMIVSRLFDDSKEEYIVIDLDEPRSVIRKKFYRLKIEFSKDVSFREFLDVFINLSYKCKLIDIELLQGLIKTLKESFLSPVPKMKDLISPPNTNSLFSPEEDRYTFKDGEMRVLQITLLRKLNDIGIHSIEELYRKLHNAIGRTKYNGIRIVCFRKLDPIGVDIVDGIIDNYNDLLEEKRKEWEEEVKRQQKLQQLGSQGGMI